MKCPAAGCPGTVRVTHTARDGERAHCERCYRAVSIESLIALIDGKEAHVRQRVIEAWARRVLGPTVFSNSEERALRVVEESVELAQALYVDTDGVHRLVDYVYARPRGEPEQEIGGTLVTVYAAAASIGVFADDVFDDEIARIHRPEVEAKVQRRQLEKRENMVAVDAESPTVAEVER